MLSKDFLKKLWELKLYYSTIPYKNTLQLQTIIRENIENSFIASTITELILNEKK